MALALDDFDEPVVEIQTTKPAGPVAPSTKSAASAVAVAPPSPSGSFAEAVSIAKKESKKAISQFGKEYGPDIVGALNPVHYNEQGPQDYTNIDWGLTLPHAAVEGVAGLAGLGAGYGVAKRAARIVSGQASVDKEAAKQYAEQNKLAKKRLEFDEQKEANKLKLAQAAQTAQQAPVPTKPAPVVNMGPTSLATAVGNAPAGAPGAPFTAPPPAQSAPPVGQAPAAVAPPSVKSLDQAFAASLAPTEPTNPLSPPARVADVPATTVDVAREIGPAVDTPDRVASAGQQTTPPVEVTKEAPKPAVEGSKVPPGMREQYKRSDKKNPMGPGAFNHLANNLGLEKAIQVWEERYGKTNVPYKEFVNEYSKAAGKEMVGPKQPLAPGAKPGGSFGTPQYIPEYIKGGGTLGPIAGLAGLAGLTALTSSPEARAAMGRAQSAIQDLGISPDIFAGKGEEMGRLGKGYVTAGNPQYRAQIAEQLKVEKDPERRQLLLEEFQKAGGSGAGRGVAPPSEYMR